MEKTDLIKGSIIGLVEEKTIGEDVAIIIKEFLS
jgi:hypothetical protein